MHEAGAAHPSLPPVSARWWKDRLRLLLESTGEGIYGVDVTGRCVFINRAGARMLGYEPQEVLHRDMHELVHHTHGDGTHYPSDACPIYNAFRRGVPCRIDDEVLWRRDGTSFYAEYSSYPIFEGGQVQGAVVTFVDITGRRHAAELLRRTNDELERRVTERTRELSDALARLRELSAYLERVREDERTRIAREIHDELGSLLVALKMDVSWLARRVEDRPPLHAKCGAMSHLIETAVDNVGRIITDLRPSILDHQGLWAALEWQAQEFAQTCELECDWKMDVDPLLPPLPQQQANAVFRIFQELLSNVARHARASAVRIRIEARGGLLRLEVTDNGRGAPARAFASPQAYGVLGMRERAGHHGGRLLIDSMPGQGTRVELTLPLPGTTPSDLARVVPP
ncbi:MAG TPA: PAS domain S-box protein [Burkholderiaceae bacterium]|nr:PAS domain S-box protein [Burkholderiaceae bacterium]